MSDHIWAIPDLEKGILSPNHKDSPKDLVNQRQNQALKRHDALEKGCIWVYKAAVQPHLDPDHRGSQLFTRLPSPSAIRSAVHITRRAACSGPRLGAAPVNTTTLHSEHRIYRKT